MVAKTFDAERNFDLAEKFDELIDRLEEVDYELIPESTVLQTISMLLVGECKRKTILKLDKDKFIDIWDDAIESIECAIDYFRHYYRIPVSRILPYNALLVPFAYFFYHHNNTKPSTENMKSYLDDFFWRISLSERYSSGLETKLAQDIKRIDQILHNQLPRYDFHADLTTEFIVENGMFRTGRSFIKAILCLMAYQEPKSFNDNSIVRINNNWLKQVNSRNYHHFFPRAYLKNKGVDPDKINHIANITIVDDFLNKRRIGSKAPSVYMETFKQENTNLESTMKTHFIDNLEEYGIWNEDYDTFFDKRIQRMKEELEKRIIKPKRVIELPPVQ